MGQTLSREIHRQHCSCGIRRSLPDGALFLCGSYCYADVVRGSEFFALYSSLCYCALRLFGEKSYSQIFPQQFLTQRPITRCEISGRILPKKLARVPMGTILDTTSGQYKTTIVDRVEGMEPTFAHLIPEMTANVLVPLVIIVYLFVMDWRMSLAEYGRKSPGGLPSVWAAGREGL